MSVLIQISDTHFGTEQESVVGALLRLITEIRPEIVVWSGDITQRARRHQFDAALQFRNQLQTPFVFVLPGNHDIPLFNLPARLTSPYAGYQRVFGANLEPHYESSEFVLIGVNTTRRYRHVDGEISLEQIRRVSQRLRSAPASCVRIVVTHQPVHVTQQQDEKNLVHGHEAAVRAWAAAGADVIMGGHIHLPYVRPLTERFTDLPRQTWAVQAGTALSWRVRHGAPNSFNLLRSRTGDEPACVVERWDYDAVSMRFAAVSSQTLQLDRSTGRSEN